MPQRPPSTVSLTEEIHDHWRTPDTRGSASPRTGSRSAPISGRCSEALDVPTSAAGSRRRQRGLGAGRQGRRKVARALGKVHAVRRCRVQRRRGSASQPVDALAAPGSGQTVTAVSLADGCDVLRIARGPEGDCGCPFPAGTVGRRVTPTYLDALTWRGLLDREPPRRPEPRAVSAPAALRGWSWKFALKASACARAATWSTPPQEVCLRCGVGRPGRTGLDVGQARGDPHLQRRPPRVLPEPSDGRRSGGVRRGRPTGSGNHRHRSRHLAVGARFG